MTDCTRACSTVDKIAIVTAPPWVPSGIAPEKDTQPSCVAPQGSIAIGTGSVGEPRLLRALRVNVSPVERGFTDKHAQWKLRGGDRSVW